MTQRTVQANPFARQWAVTGDDVIAATRRVGESGRYVLGPEVAAFESELAGRLGRTHAVGCASGLDAIELGLRAAGLPPGARVLTTPLSAFATTLGIVRAGGVPVFVDVDRSGLLDLERAARLLTSDSDVRHAVPVHLFGHALDAGALTDLKERFDLCIVEDCAQAIGARSDGRPVGGVGVAAALSFYPTKNLGAIGDGGALTCDGDELAARARRLRDYGQRAKFVHAELGLNSRLDELQAAILRTAFLPRLDGWTERRARIAARYREGLVHPAVEILPAPPASTSAWHLFPVRVPARARPGFLEHLRRAGVEAGVHYPTAIPDQPALAGEPHVVHGGIENARRLAAEEVSLPIHPFLDDADVDAVIESVARWRA